MNRFKPYSTNRDRKGPVNDDRHCQDCGTLIKGAAHQKPRCCFKCKAPQEGRDGWNANGWGRCANCDAWINENHCFCMCGFANNEAIERKKRQCEAARQQDVFRKEQETAELRRMLSEATRTNMVLQQQIDERAAEQRQIEEREAAARLRANNEIFEQQMQGVNLGNDDD